MENISECRTYGVCDIQNILGISRTMAYKLVNSEPFRVVRVGNRIRISKKSFDEWLDQDSAASSAISADENGSSDDNHVKEESDNYVDQMESYEAADRSDNADGGNQGLSMSADIAMLIKLMKDPEAVRILKKLAAMSQ